MREQRTVEMRIGGSNYREIGEAIGVTDEAARQMAIRVLQRLEMVANESGEELRRLDTERIDRMIQGLWQKACLGNVQAVDRVIRLMERKARLWGYEMPVRVEFDWRKEVQEAGASPSDVFEKMVRVAHQELQKQTSGDSS